MPDSWTARGALLLTCLAVLVGVVSYQQAPPRVPLTSLDAPTLAAAALRPAYIASWVGWCSSLLTTCATLWVAYGARNVVPIPRGWSRTPPSAELGRDESADL